MTEEFFDPNLEPAPYADLWHSPGTKVYFVGVDRGMLYTESGEGVPWIGITAVDENPLNGDIQPFYMDGVRRRNDHYLEEFSATISAYSAPKEFAPCEGETELAPGMFLGQQPRESFGFSYRSFIGNDTDGMERHYELNLVYGAMSKPVARSRKTVSENPEPDVRSWEIETLPLDVMDHLPSARIRLDSRYVDPEKLSQIQDILYGSVEPPRLPEIDEIYNILTHIEDVIDDEEEIPWEPEEPEGI